MLSHYPAVATMPATDMDRAKKWYLEKLGFEAVVETSEYVEEFNAGGGTRFTLFPIRVASGAGHTVLSFEVDDVEGRRRRDQRTRPPTP